MTPVRKLALVTALAAAALGAGAASASDVLVVRDGRVSVEDDPYLPPRGAAELPPPPAGAAPARAAAKRGPTVSGALRKALRDKGIDQGDHDRYLTIYKDARKARKTTEGRCRTQLRSVIVQLERIARAGALTASRMPALFLQLQHNTNFWSTTPRPQLDNGDRVTFGSSPVVFQHYKKQGLQFQPLANWGKANGLYNACKELEENPASERACRKKAFRRLLSRMTALASKRGGYTTWEYYFEFGGGTPPWTSGLSQGTGIQALARGSELLGEKKYARTAAAALGAFEKGPPAGIRVRSGRGTHYLIYSFAPRLRVLNAFIQALVGLYDYSKITGSKKAEVLFKRGDRAARKELPKYDDRKEKWSLYSRGGAPATYGYHELVTGFLENLCERTGTKTYCRYAKRFRMYLGTRNKPTPGEPKRLKCGAA